MKLWRLDAWNLSSGAELGNKRVQWCLQPPLFSASVVRNGVKKRGTFSREHENMINFGKQGFEIFLKDLKLNLDSVQIGLIKWHRWQSNVFFEK